MSKRAKQAKRRDRGAPSSDEAALDTPADAAAGESRVSLSVTVFWMLAAFATLLAEIGALVAAAVLLWGNLGNEARTGAQLLFYLLYLTAVIAGLLTLVLTWVAHRWRDAPPPASVTTVVIVIAAIPPLSVALSWLSGLVR